MFIGVGMPRERRCERLRVGSVPLALGLGRAGLGQFVAEAAYLRVFGGLQSTDLLLHGANAGDLADIRRHAPEQEVSRNIESTCSEVPLVCLGLHFLGPRETFRECCE